jgi:ribosomal protein S18 acetylase RimI-like enzyme
VTPRVTIRAASGADLNVLAEVAGSRDRAQVRLQAAARGDDGMLVAVAGDTVAGAVSVRWREGCDPPYPWLYGLAVVPSARRRGIGRALIRAGEALCRERGFGTVSLDVDVGDHAAIAFYERLGYVVDRPHEHLWRAIDPRTGTVTGEGLAPTWIMRHTLGGQG